MSTHQFDVRYRQSENDSENGRIIFNDTSITASGRLDQVGQSVFAEGFEFGSDVGRTFMVSIECTRTSRRAMRVTIVFEDRDGYVPGPGYVPDAVIEKVVENVPLDFH